MEENPRNKKEEEKPENKKEEEKRRKQKGGRKTTKTKRRKKNAENKEEEEKRVGRDANDVLAPDKACCAWMLFLRRRARFSLFSLPHGAAHVHSELDKGAKREGTKGQREEVERAEASLCFRRRKRPTRFACLWPAMISRRRPIASRLSPLASRVLVRSCRFSRAQGDAGGLWPTRESGE